MTDFAHSWILPEFKTYINEELSFELEAANNARIRKVWRRGLLRGAGRLNDCFAALRG